MQVYELRLNEGMGYSVYINTNNELIYSVGSNYRYLDLNKVRSNLINVPRKIPDLEILSSKWTETTDIPSNTVNFGPNLFIAHLLCEIEPGIVVALAINGVMNDALAVKVFRCSSLIFSKEQLQSIGADTDLIDTYQLEHSKINQTLSLFADEDIVSTPVIIDKKLIGILGADSKEIIIDGVEEIINYSIDISKTERIRIDTEILKKIDANSFYCEIRRKTLYIMLDLRKTMIETANRIATQISTLLKDSPVCYILLITEEQFISLDTNFHFPGISRTKDTDLNETHTVIVGNSVYQFENCKGQITSLSILVGSDFLTLISRYNSPLLAFHIDNEEIECIGAFRQLSDVPNSNEVYWDYIHKLENETEPIILMRENSKIGEHSVKKISREQLYKSLHKYIHSIIKSQNKAAD